MIVVVSVIGGILVIAIVLMVLALVYWKGGSPFSAVPKGGHHVHRSDKHQHHHRRHSKHHKYKARRDRSDHGSYQPHNILEGYSFYRGVENPVFQESLDYPNSAVIFYKGADRPSHASRNNEEPPKYDYAVNWNDLDKIETNELHY